MKLRYITGRGGSAKTGLSKYLAGKAQDYRGLSNNETLHRQAVDDQIRIKSFWRDVRTYWSQVYESSQTFEVKKRVDGELMFTTLFDMADRPYENSDSRQEMIKQTIRRFVQHKKVEASN